MSYRGMGEYVATSGFGDPRFSQAAAGLGAGYGQAAAGLGAGYGQAAAGFGAFGTLDATSVWSDWLAGSKGDNAAGMRAANAIRMSLSALGFGTAQMAVAWGNANDKSAYTAFANKYGIGAQGGMPIWWPSQVGLAKLQELDVATAQGAPPPGDQPVVIFHVVPGVVTPVPGVAPKPAPAPGTPSAAIAKITAGMSTGEKVGLAVGGVALLGLLAVELSKKKKPATTTAAA